MSTPVTTEPAANPGHPGTYFDSQATWGVTKHLGGTVATDELLRHCGVGDDTLLLEIGCGVGITPCHAVQKLGCRVVAADLSTRMIGWARRRTQRLQVEDRVSFAAADARWLPFADNSFDAVICESVMAFVPDKAGALAEFVRVTRPGGRIGLTEGTWIMPPPPDLPDYLARAMGGVTFLSADGWTALLQRAGLAIGAAEAHRMSTIDQLRSDIGMLDYADLVDRGRAWRTFLRLLVTSPAFQQYIRTLWPLPPVMFRFFDHFGYGIYVGRKEARDAERTIEPSA